ncbi:MAG TPA: ABC transporter permease [Pseudorhodoplanes sp.]|jgi:putrescine transport system permease protein|nr:ABC transporter permease [Pseudorhodoplanes sp.]
MSGGHAWSGRARRLVVAVPYLWLLIFFAVPFAIVLRMSVSQNAIASPPYLPLFDPAAGWAGVKEFAGALTFDNFQRVFSDSIYTYAYLKSLQIAAMSTAILLAIAFPVAYGMACAPRRWQPVLVMAVVLPFWTAFLIRIYAWINILQRDGLLNDVLMALGLIGEPAGWLSSDTAIFIGIVYSYLPFMVLPIYSVLEKMDQSLLEAAADLGCPRWKAFWLVTVPLAMPGVLAGALLCFIPVIGEFVIPDLLGGSGTMMIGQALWVDFFGNLDWPAASAIAIVLLALLLGPIMIYQHLQMRALEGRRW